MVRSIISYCAILFVVSGYAQSPSGTGRWLQRHQMELSMAVMAGASYFEYDTKAIEPHFITPEISLDLMLAKRVAEHWWIQTGIVGSYKHTREPSYNPSSPKYYHDMIYRLEDLDKTVSTTAHWSWVLPLKVHYYPGKLGLSLGGFVRHFSGLSSPGSYWDVLAGQFDAGALAGASLPLGNFRLGVEYYHGLVNLNSRVYYVTSPGGTVIPEYKIFNRSAQVSLRYTFYQDHEEAPPTPWRR